MVVGTSRPDARHTHEALASPVRATDRDEACVHLSDPAVDIRELILQLGKKLSG